MDPIASELLTALAGGAGGEAAKQAWAWLSTLVRRPFNRGEITSEVPAISSGEAELAALAHVPADPSRAQALSAALSQRAVVDPGFRTELERWHQQVQLINTGTGDVHNEISGGTFHGPVIPGRDFSGISFGNPSPQPPPPE